MINVGRARPTEGSSTAGRLAPGRGLDFRHIAEHAPTITWVTQPSGDCLWLNRAWYDYTGQEETASLGFGWLDAIHPDDRPRVERGFQDANAQNAPFRFEYRLRAADGSYRWFIDAAAPCYGADGVFEGYIGSVIDIDDRRRAEQRVIESEARLRTLTNVAPAFVWLADEQGEVQHFNDRWYEFTGQTPEEALPDGWLDALHAEDAARVTAEWARARAEGVSYQMECRCRRHDGIYRWYLVRAEPLRGPEGAITAWMGASTDIHDRVVAEEHQELLINELNHRVKNTLATVQSLATQTAAATSSPAEFREAFEGRLIGLSSAHDLLTASHWEGADLAGVIATVTQPWRDQGRITCSGPRVWLSPRQTLSMSMALHELTTNAAKYGALSRSGGEVSVTWTRHPSGHGERLELCWREHGGPPVPPPTRRGFGTRLLERGLAHEFGGAVQLSFRPEGVVCEIDLPL